jgi:hypothetical protein
MRVRNLGKLNGIWMKHKNDLDDTDLKSSCAMCMKFTKWMTQKYIDELTIRKNELP